MNSITRIGKVSATLGNSFGVPNVIAKVIIYTLVTIVVCNKLGEVIAIARGFIPFVTTFCVVNTLVVVVMGFHRVNSTFNRVFSKTFDVHSIKKNIVKCNVSETVHFNITHKMFSGRTNLNSSMVIRSSSSTGRPMARNV